MNDNILQKIVCRTKSGTLNGSAFLISPNFALTAQHNIKENEDTVILKFADGTVITAKVLDLQKSIENGIDAVLLKLEDNSYSGSFLDLVFNESYKHTKNKIWNSFGFPNEFPRDFSGTYREQYSNDYKWNIDLLPDSHTSNTEEGYEGLSGAPFIVDNQIYGIIITGTINKQLGAISIHKVCNTIDFEKVKEESESVKEQINSSEKEWNELMARCKSDSYNKLSIHYLEKYLREFPLSNHFNETDKLLKEARTWFETLKISNFEHYTKNSEINNLKRQEFDDRFYYLALKNIGEFGDTDIFPFPIENRVFKDKTSQVITCLKNLDKEFGNFIDSEKKSTKKDKNFNEAFKQKLPKLIETVVPIGYSGFRWATQIEPIWNAYYLSLVLSVANKIEAKRIDSGNDLNIFSYRFEPDFSKGSLFKQRIGYQFSDKSIDIIKHLVSSDKFELFDQNKSSKVYINRDEFISVLANKMEITNTNWIEEICKYSLININEWLAFQIHAYEFIANETNKDYTHVIVCDIADFYSRIDHEYLFTSLEGLDVETSNKIKSLVKIFSNYKTSGLPIGGNASRILAECLLSTIDYYLYDRKIQFCRFVDDFYIFAKSEDDSIKKLNNFNAFLLKDTGLALQKYKIQILSKSEFVNSIETRLFWKADDKKTQDKARIMALSRFDYYSENREVIEDNDRINIEELINEELRKTRIHEEFAKRLLIELKRSTFQDENEHEFKNRISNAFYKIFFKRERKEGESNDKLLKLYPIFQKLLIGLKFNIEGNRIVDIEYENKVIKTKEFILWRLLSLFNNQSYIFDVEINKSYFYQLLLKIDTTEICYNKEKYVLKDFYKENLKSSNSILEKSWLLVSLLAIGESAWFSQEFPKHINENYWLRRVFILSSALLPSVGESRVKADSLSEFEKVLFDWAKEHRSDYKLLL